MMMYDMFRLLCPPSTASQPKPPSRSLDAALEATRRLRLPLPKEATLDDLETLPADLGPVRADEVSAWIDEHLAGPALTRWCGQGAERLELKGEIAPACLAALCGGWHPHPEILQARYQRGFDRFEDETNPVVAIEWISRAAPSTAAAWLRGGPELREAIEAFMTTATMQALEQLDQEMFSASPLGLVAAAVRLLPSGDGAQELEDRCLIPTLGVLVPWPQRAE
jgi:hypothetical protein